MKKILAVFVLSLPLVSCYTVEYPDGTKVRSFDAETAEKVLYIISDAK